MSEQAIPGALVAVRPASDPRVPPLYWVPGAGGKVEEVATLAGALATGGAVHGFVAHDARGLPQPPTVAAVAADYADALRVNELGARFAVGGNSFGAVTAFEVAVELARRGFPPAALVLADPIVREIHRPVTTKDRIRWLLKRARGRRGTKRSSAALANRERTLAWKPSQPYAGAVTLITTEQNRSASGDDALGLRPSLTGRLTLVELPGNHGGILKPPRLATVAAAVDEALSAVS